jgi:hypothetical protein
MFGSASSAVCTAAAAALYAIVPVVRPSYVSVVVPPVGVPLIVSVCTLFVPAGETLSVPWNSHSRYARMSVSACSPG